MEYGLIGERLGHSFSKIIHTELCGYNYELCELAPHELEAFVKKAEFKAINVTIPYKEKIIPFLHFVDQRALEIGAVNTVVNKNGKLFGFNTDFMGLTALINRTEVSLKNKKVLILGSGGTSKTAFAVAKSLGAAVIFRVSRKASEGLITYDEAVKEHSDADIIINTTPCGMYPNNGLSAVDINNFPKLSAVFDAVYNPLSSQLVVDAKEKGIRAAGGFYMLVAQAFYAAEMFLDKKLDPCEIDRIYKKLLNEKQNLVLIGMPGCGKTTIGKAVAKELGKKFIDSDDEIVRMASKQIPEIFAERGEEGFRALESEVIARLSKEGGFVIATGGGAILKKRNIELLKGNGKVVFIDRPLKYLVTTDDRPLSSNRELLEKRYNERYSIYKSSADICIDASQNLMENINKTKEAFLNEDFSS